MKRKNKYENILDNIRRRLLGWLSLFAGFVLAFSLVILGVFYLLSGDFGMFLYSLTPTLLSFPAGAYIFLQGVCILLDNQKYETEFYVTRGRSLHAHYPVETLQYLKRTMHCYFWELFFYALFSIACIVGFFVYDKAKVISIINAVCFAIGGIVFYLKAMEIKVDIENGDF